MSASRKNRGGRPRGVNTPISASGTHDLGMLDLAEAAAQHQAAQQALAHAFRRSSDAGAHLHRAYMRIAQAWAREHDGYSDPAPLADIIPFPAQHGRGPEPSEPMHQVAA